jgi:hypothetical protein
MMMKCSACGKPRDRSNQRYCKRCNAAYQRDWRAKTKRATVVEIEQLKKRVAALEKSDRR